MTRRTLRWYLAPILAAPVVAVVLIVCALIDLWRGWHKKEHTHG